MLNSSVIFLCVGCTCGCIKHVNISQIRQMRMLNSSFDKYTLDMLLMGKLSTILDRSEMTKKQKSKQTVRKRGRCNFTHEGRAWLDCFVQSFILMLLIVFENPSSVLDVQELVMVLFLI